MRGRHARAEALGRRGSPATGQDSPWTGALRWQSKRAIEAAAREGGGGRVKGRGHVLQPAAACRRHPPRALQPTAFLLDGHGHAPQATSLPRGALRQLLFLSCYGRRFKSALEKVEGIGADTLRCRMLAVGVGCCRAWRCRVSVRGCRGCQSVRMCARALSGAVGVVGLSGEFGCCQVVSDCRGFGKSSLTLWCQACIKVRPRQQQTRSLGIEPKHAYLEIYAPQNFFKPKVCSSTLAF